MNKIFIFMLMVLVIGCTRREEFETTKESVSPASEIDWLGKKTPLLGESALRLEAPLPKVSLINEKMKSEVLNPDGRVKLISIIPSIDTEVCDQQTHILGETRALNSKVDRITISKDLPYAQSRFAEESKIKNVKYYSDYKTGEFGRSLGLEIQRNGLLARAIVVVDGRGIIRHFQIVPKIYVLPDMARAIKVANELAKAL